MKKKQLSGGKIKVHVYGSRYEADKKAAQKAYQNWRNGKEINFPREGAHAHSFGIPIAGSLEEIANYVWQFVCIAELSPNYQFEVQAFEGFSPAESTPLFYQALKLRNVTLPKEYHAYIRAISSERGLPTPHDINVDDSLDERAAVRNFLGKTQEDVYHELEESIDCDCSFMESFYYLGPIAFAYYAPAWEKLYLKYQGRITTEYDDAFGEDMVAEATLFFLSQRTLLSAEQETPQGRETIAHLLELVEHHYATSELYDDSERNKALQKCRTVRERITR